MVLIIILAIIFGLLLMLGLVVPQHRGKAWAGGLLAGLILLLLAMRDHSNRNRHP